MENYDKTRTVKPLFDEKETVRREAPVAVMDSGVGGICVLRELRRLLPREQLLYFGDSANAPYGARSAEEVRALVLSNAQRLLAECKALVVACNTATALCIEELRCRYPTVPIVGMEPALRPALQAGRTPRVLVLATPITLREARFAALLQKCEKTAHVCPISAPDIVHFVEKGQEDSPELVRYLEALLAPCREPVPDAVVLGCTHFSFARRAILRALGAQVPTFDGALGTARELARRLREGGLENPEPARGAVRLTSSAPGVLPFYARLLFAE